MAAATFDRPTLGGLLHVQRVIAGEDEDARLCREARAEEFKAAQTARRERLDALETVRQAKANEATWAEENAAINGRADPASMLAWDQRDAARKAADAEAAAIEEKAHRPADPALAGLGRPPGQPADRGQRLALARATLASPAGRRRPSRQPAVRARPRTFSRASVLHPFYPRRRAGRVSSEPPNRATQAAHPATPAKRPRVVRASPSARPQWGGREFRQEGGGD